MNKQIQLIVIHQRKHVLFYVKLDDKMNNGKQVGGEFVMFAQSKHTAYIRKYALTKACPNLLTIIHFVIELNITQHVFTLVNND